MATEEQVKQYILSNPYSISDATDEGDGLITFNVKVDKNYSKEFYVVVFTDWIRLSVWIRPLYGFDLDIEKLLSVAYDHYEIGGIVKRGRYYELRHSISIEAFSPYVFSQAIDHTKKCYRVMKELKELNVE